MNYRFYKGHNVAFRKPHKFSLHSQTHFFNIPVNMNQKESDGGGEVSLWVRVELRAGIW